MTDPAKRERAALDVLALRRAAIIGVALAVVVGIVTTPIYLAAFGWDLEAGIFVYPESVLEQGRDAAVLWRWGFLGDMLYSYLLLLPLALFLHRRLRGRQPWLADVGLAGALAYILIGGSAAAILAQAGSSLIEAYHAAASADQPAIVVAFHVLRDSSCSACGRRSMGSPPAYGSSPLGGCSSSIALGWGGYSSCSACGGGASRS